MSAPLVLEKAGVRVDIGVLRWIRRAASAGTVLRVSPVRVLGPEAMQDKG